MSRRTKDRLYGLLPSVYRQRDITSETPELRPLRDLTEIMEKVLNTLENDIENLYDSWFIETCNEWVAPYIGDLVGASLLRSVKEGAAVSARAYVANTIRYRKRKGTVAVMEEIARNVTGWDACAVEFFQVLSTTQNLNHARPWNLCTPNICDPEPLEKIDTAFDSVPHTLDVRSIKKGTGYYNIPNLGIFLWRLNAYPVRRARAFDHGGGRYSFSQIGKDMPLFNHPTDQTSNAGVSGEINVSTPIRRLAFEENKEVYYGEEKSILVEVGNEKKTVDQIVVCDLSDCDDEGNWRLPKEFKPDGDSGGEVPIDKVAIDPVLGRLALPSSKASNVYVTYYYGFSADMGGGFYHRDMYTEYPQDAKIYTIAAGGVVKGDYGSISEALKQWKADEKPNAIFHILDSETYIVGGESGSKKTLKVNIPADTTLVMRSAQEQRATLTAANSDSQQKLTIAVSGEEGSAFVLDGLLLDKSLSLSVKEKTSRKVGAKESNLGALVIQHCSLVPSPGGANNVDVEGNDYVSVTLNRTICGGVSLSNSKGKLFLKDTIIDRPSEDYAIEGYEANLENTTVFGKVKLELLNLASNVIFTDTVIVKRRQEGCVRFSYIPYLFDEGTERSRVPRCYRCQPETETSKVIPRFTSEEYGSPGYAQLHKRVVKEISEGADNESEMGAFNYLYQSQRVNNVLATFAEYLPFGLEAGIILVT